MINWETDDEVFFAVVSEASDLVHLENELTETIARIMASNLFKNEFVEFYSDATNGSFFVYELDKNKERTEDTKTVHFSALKLWEGYEDSNEFDSDMKIALHNSIENLMKKGVRIPFGIVVRDELGDEEEVY